MRRTARRSASSASEAAARVRRCGAYRVWFDPTYRGGVFFFAKIVALEVSEIIMQVVALAQTAASNDACGRANGNDAL